MRLLVILSPTDRWGTKTEYTRLRKFLHIRWLFANSTGSVYADSAK